MTFPLNLIDTTLCSGISPPFGSPVLVIGFHFVIGISNVLSKFLYSTVKWCLFKFRSVKILL
jgi:hypothetical protein